MEGPDNKRGTVALRTLWGEIAAEGNFSKPLDELLDNEEWKKAVGLKGGPFCYMTLELNVPF